jgi:hypothetical protein
MQESRKNIDQFSRRSRGTRAERDKAGGDVLSEEPSRLEHDLTISHHLGDVPEANPVS